MHINIFIFKWKHRNNLAKIITRNYKKFSRIGGQEPGIVHPWFKKV